MGFGGCVHQSEGITPGVEELPWMRLERHHAKRGPKITRHSAGQIDDSLMSKVNTVKVADGGNGSPVGWINEKRVSDDAHSAA
jgi:hypothetical protein